MCARYDYSPNSSLILYLYELCIIETLNTVLQHKKISTKPIIKRYLLLESIA